MRDEAWGYCPLVRACYLLLLPFSILGRAAERMDDGSPCSVGDIRHRFPTAADTDSRKQ